MAKKQQSYTPPDFSCHNPADLRALGSAGEAIREVMRRDAEGRRNRTNLKRVVKGKR